MSALNLRLPDSVHRHIREIAKRDGVSINTFITSAVAEKISALTTEEYIAKRAKRAREGAFKRVIDRVPKRKPLPGDDPTRRQPDISKAKKILDWEPKVKFETGLQKII